MSIFDKMFENKIVYFGTTASSLFDIKTTPTSKIYPGVEVQATYVNNLLDNSFITKIDTKITLLISILLGIITGLLVMKLASAAIISLTFVSMYVIYTVFTYLIMKYQNIISLRRIFNIKII